MIRFFLETDLPSLLFIEKMTQQDPWSEEIFKQCFRMGGSCWVVECEGKVVGFIITSFQIGECHILNLCIHPEYQRRGFGQQLLVHILQIARAKEIKMAYLEVRRSNQNAILLYQKEGFVEIGDRKGYYATNNGREDAIIYAKDLGIDETL